MKQNLLCLRCNQKMQLYRSEKLQFGENSWLLGDLPNLMAGAMETDIYHCPRCGKLEFFLADGAQTELPQKQCPKCGKMHDFDYPKCPFCKYNYHV